MALTCQQASSQASGGYGAAFGLSLGLRVQGSFRLSLGFKAEVEGLGFRVWG